MLRRLHPALVLVAACVLLPFAAAGMSTLSFRASEPALREYAVALREKRPPPDLPFYAPRFQHAFCDAKGNVVFVTYSDTILEEGFLLRNGDATVPPVGEPTIALERVSGDWWLFWGG